MRMRLFGLFATCLLLALPAAPAAAQDWKLEPYLWFAALDGTVDVGPIPVPVDLSFGDYAGDIRFAAQVRLEANLDDFWSVGGDFTYLGVGTDVAIDPPGVGPVTGEFDVNFVQLEGLVYRSRTRHANGGWSIYGGFRYNSIDTDLTWAGSGGLGASLGRQNWADPVVGLRVRTNPSSKFIGILRGDVGGFSLGSDIVINGSAIAGYRITRVININGGFRVMDMNYDNGKDGAEFFGWDVSQYGFQFGVGFEF